MKTAFLVLIVTLFQASVHSRTVLDKTQDELNEAFEYCSSSLHLNTEILFNVTNRLLLPEHDPELQKMYKCVARETHSIDSNDNFKLNAIENIAEAIVDKITRGVPEASKIRFTAESAVEHCKDIPKQNNVGLTVIKLSNCIRTYAATKLSF